MINGYDYWINADDNRAIWYNALANDWSIGDKDDLGENLQGLMTVENFDKNKGNCPTGSHKWEYVHNGEWTETNDVFVECSMPSTTSDTTNTVSEFLYYKNSMANSETFSLVLKYQSISFSEQPLLSLKG